MMIEFCTIHASVAFQFSCHIGSFACIQFRMHMYQNICYVHDNLHGLIFLLIKYCQHGPGFPPGVLLVVKVIQPRGKQRQAG